MTTVEQWPKLRNGYTATSRKRRWSWPGHANCEAAPWVVAENKTLRRLIGDLAA